MKLVALLAGLASVSAMRAPCSCAEKGQIALVFSDGPVQATPEVLTTLANDNISATFMFSTVNIDHTGVTDVIKQTVEEGHTVGLRTNPIYDFSSMSEDDIREAITMELNVLNEVAGQQTKYITINQPDVNNQTVLKVIDELDLVLINYNYDMYGLDDDSEDILNRWRLKLSSVRPQSTSYIVLQHDQRESELQIVPDVVKYGSEAGFTFVNLDNCLDGVTMDNGSGNDGEVGAVIEPVKNKKNSAAAPALALACLVALLAM
ncbi:peptidoglycan-N-acetylglucosamine deacetylase [Nematocida homosporus]|uniref:peptidoglycan-N-acetylglucosamine deacetylase n=1 Tax=Nematocida homosporus TaxID=1912981 RepID=UPI00221E90A6|nr:peptidoglycan-N-acetylglucosamine deacetylase [Nematocida homosporus]KAI5185650.1 peptidoglycan-N-acetylglucosamine deacetylase [Nematocida homosporus]